MRKREDKVNNTKKQKRKFNKKKFFITLAIFWAIGTVITVVSLYLVERYVISLSGADTHAEEKESKNNNGTKKINISKNAKDIQYSFDNKYYTYLFENKVQLMKKKILHIINYYMIKT